MIIKEFTTKITTEEPIVDIEICNNLAPEWVYENCDIVTLGILIKNKAVIIQREKNDNLEYFKDKLKETLKDYPTFYSFNFNMECGGLKGFLGKDYIVNELKLWSGKGWNKNRFFEEIGKIAKVDDEIKCPFNGDSSKVPEAYSNENYEDIIAHNLTCLLKESYIKKYGNKLLEEYKDRINSDGWIKKEEENSNRNCKDNSPSQKQLEYLKDLGCDEIPNTKEKASDLIEEYKSLFPKEMRHTIVDEKEKKIFIHRLDKVFKIIDNQSKEEGNFIIFNSPDGNFMQWVRFDEDEFMISRLEDNLTYSLYVNKNELYKLANYFFIAGKLNSDEDLQSKHLSNLNLKWESI